MSSTHEVKPISEGQARVMKPVMKAMSRLTVWLYRTTGGRIGGTFLRGAPVCLLTMKGRKSGRRITTPLIYTTHGDDVLLVASQGGMDHHPVWYLNLVANPAIEIQRNAEVREMVARQATPEEKSALWHNLVEVYPDFDDYQRRTERDIPVMICSPRR